MGAKQLQEDLVNPGNLLRELKVDILTWNKEPDVVIRAGQPLNDCMMPGQARGSKVEVDAYKPSNTMSKLLSVVQRLNYAVMGSLGKLHSWLTWRCSESVQSSLGLCFTVRA